MKNMNVVLILLMSLFLMTLCLPNMVSNQNSLISAADEDYESYANHYGKSRYVELKAGQVLRSVKVYSPDKKYYAYTEKIADRTRTIKEQGNSPVEFSKVYLVDTSNGSQALLFSKESTVPYFPPMIKIEDWSEDSKTLLFSEAYHECGTSYHIYNIEKRKLDRIPDAEKYGRNGLESRGWSNGKFMLWGFGSPSFEWNPSTNKLIQLEQQLNPEIKLKRFGLVRKGDKPVIKSID